MATKRIDIRFIEGKYTILPSKEYTVAYDDTFTEVILYNWKIILNNYEKYLYIQSESKAKTTKNNTFYIKPKEGSLFLYNSTTTWYWYFRDKETQDFLDEFNIGKVVSIPDDRTVLTFHQYYIFDETNKNLFIDSLTTKKSTRLFHFDPGTKYSCSDLIVIYNSNKDQNLIDFDIKVSINKFILIEKLATGYRKLYIKSSYNLNAAMDYLRSLEKIEFVRIEPIDLDLKRRVLNAKNNKF